MAPTADVEVTATFGAAARAVATDKGLLNDTFAEPLLCAVGIDYLTRAIKDHAFAAEGSPVGDAPAMTALMDALAAHPLRGRIPGRRGQGGHPPGGDPGVGPGFPGVPAVVAAGTTVYEIDRPQVLDFKSDVLRGLDATLATNRCAVGIDLRHDWPAALRRVGFDAARPTVWVAEQLLVGYLPPQDQSRLLREVTAASAPGSRLAADHMPTWNPLQLGPSAPSSTAGGGVASTSIWPA